MGRIGSSVSLEVGYNNCTKGQFRGMFPFESLNWPQFRLILSVTGFAFAGGWLVEEHSLPIHFAAWFVAALTCNPAMSAFERKRGALVVVEFSWFPAC